MPQITKTAQTASRAYFFFAISRRSEVRFLSLFYNVAQWQSTGMENSAAIRLRLVFFKNEEENVC